MLGAISTLCLVLLAVGEGDGRITGTAAPVEKVESIVAVPRFLDVVCPSCKRRFVARGNVPGGSIQCKACGKKMPVPVYEARLNRETRQFTITGLPVGQRYDLIVETTVGRMEGIDLSPLESELERLRRRRARANPREFSKDDRKSIVELITKVRQFENFVRALYVKGHGEKATALVEKARLQDDKTGKFHSEKGNEAIWRVELWHFRKWFGGWERVSNVETVLYRKRMPRAQYDAMNWVFVDDLGGIEVNESGASRPVNVDVPRGLDPNLGRTAQTK